MNEGVQKADNMGIVSGRSLPAWVSMVFLYFLQDLDFVEGGLHIMWAALLNFDGHIGVVFEVLAQPHCGEMAPAQLLDDDVAVDEDFADVHGMIATDLVVFDSLVLRIVVLIEFHQELVKVVGARFIRNRSFF